MSPFIKLIITCLFAASISHAGERLKVPQNASNVSDVAQIERIEKRFMEEREVLERQADRHYAQLKDAIDTTVKLVVFLLLAAGAVFTFLVGRNRGDVRKLMDSVFRKQLDKIVATELEAVRDRIGELQGGLRQLMSFRERRVVWIALQEENIAATLTAFASVGLNRIEVQTPRTGHDANIGEADLVVLSFDGAAASKDILHTVVSEILNRTPTIHLVVYTYADGIANVRIEAREMQALAAVAWFSVANFPSTMISQVTSLVRGAVDIPRS